MFTIEKWTHFQHNQLNNIAEKWQSGLFLTILNHFLGQNRVFLAIGHKIKFGLWVSQGPPGMGSV